MYSLSIPVLTALPILATLLSLTHAEPVAVLKINAGGLPIGDYLGDPSSFVTGANKFYRGPVKAGLTVGNSHRWGNIEGFAYNFPTGPGTYDIDLVFAEVFGPAKAVGKRIFDVAIEDTVVLKNFDVFKEAGSGDKEITKSFKAVAIKDDELSVAFIKGTIENPMVSAIIIKSTDGSDIDVGEIVTGEGTGAPITDPEKEFDHQAHAVTGGPYLETDFNNNGFATIAIDGTLSHSHYNNAETGESGKIVSYTWILQTNGPTGPEKETISTKPIFSYDFPVGTSKLQLNVKDQTGDVASAPTEVKVLPSTAGGAYCYYYNNRDSPLPKDLDDPVVRPDEGHSSNLIDFQPDEFPYSKKDEDGGTSPWAVRCVTDYVSPVTKQYKVCVKYQGAEATLFVNGGQKKQSGASEDAPTTACTTVTLKEGKNPVQILYYKSSDTASPQLSFLVDDKVAPASSLGFSASNIIPTISSISSLSVSPEGGGQLQIIGTGFFNSVIVKIGASEPTFRKISSTELVITDVPSEASAGSPEVNILIVNKAGSSNKLGLTYSADAKKGVSWEQTFFKTPGNAKFSIKQVTSIAIGPDSNYYMGSLFGYVSKVVVNRDLVVTSECKSDPIGASRAILGIAFNYASPTFRAYVTANSLYWASGGPFKGKPEGWANGAIETLTAGCGCLCYEKKIITGLPVSNHDHGVNSLMFKDGDLFISVGGFTNAGHNTPGNKLGGYPDNPLSGAILIAKLSKGGAFNGKITYDQYTNAETSKQTGGDVSVYASGLRNCFGMTEHTNGKIWATDNGGNFGYGDVSVSCTEHKNFATKQFDELNLIEKGNFYGHPNRNRKECVFGTGVPPKATVVSSTTGVVEYTSNAFLGSLKSELVLSKYAASGSGVTSRTTVAGDNINLIQMGDYSGLNVVNGLHGELIMPRVQQHFVAVLKPKYTAPSGPFVIAVSPRKGIPGATVFVSGENFVAGLTVKFGAAAATGVKLVGSTGFFCKVPAGSGKVSVVVTVGGVSSKVYPGFDFIYV